MSDRQSGTDGQSMTIGSCHDCLLDVVAGDLVNVRADVAIAAICSRRDEGQPLKGGLAEMDCALRGALSRLRADGIFMGGWGETLYLSSLPSSVSVRGVVMLGLGTTGQATLTRLQKALKISGTQAARMGAVHATFAPAQVDTGSSRFNPVASAKAMIKGVAEVVGQPGCSIRRWSFVTPADQLEVVAQQFSMAFRELADH